MDLGSASELAVRARLGGGYCRLQTAELNILVIEFQT